MDQNGSFGGGGTDDFTGAAGSAGTDVPTCAVASVGTGDSTGAVGAGGTSEGLLDGARSHVASSQSVFEAKPDATNSDVSESRDGLSGSLVLQSAECLTQYEAAATLSRLDALARWTQAQQAKILHRMETVFRDDLLHDIGREDPGLTFSLAAEEAAAILHLPTNTSKMLMSDAGRLCTTHIQTLCRLEEGVLSYGHVQTVLDQSQNVPNPELAGFETELLELAATGQTSPQFRVKARRLREKSYPETIPLRHKSAFDRRRVCLAPDEDGMSWLSALLPAARAQMIYTQLTTAARGEQSAGDSRGVDQLRADILADLLEGDPGDDAGSGGRSETAGSGTDCSNCHGKSTLDGRAAGGNGLGTATGPDTATETGLGTATEPDASIDDETADDAPDLSAKGKRARARARTEILVLITAETLYGADEEPADLHGYGPISPETARRLAREAAHWTPVERDPDTDEILRVGRRRKVPAGLKLWLRARDGTCRFPGCRTNAVISEIDHTKPWSHGGETDHDNLEHLCRRHHMFKSRGFWKAKQSSPGIIEWTSPGGRTYRTDPFLTLATSLGVGGASRGIGGTGRGIGGTGRGIGGTLAMKPVMSSMSGWSSADEPSDYGDDPPPF